MHILKYTMNSDIKKLTKAQKQIANEFENSIVSPPKQEESLQHKSVNNYEPPEQFQDRQKKQRPPKPNRKPPPPLPLPTIKELTRALKEHAKSYEVEIQDNLNPLNHFTKTKALVESHLKDLLQTMKDSNSLKHWR